MKDVIALVTALADRGQRAALSEAIGRALGGRELLVFARDPEAKVFVPAPGFRQTLPGGASWKNLLERAEAGGRFGGHVEFPSRGEQVPFSALSNGESLVVLLGSDAPLDDGALCLPLLEALFRAELASQSAEARARIAETAARHAATLTMAVEAARVDADRARVQAESAARAKDEFLAMLGHELRNPLAPILTALELLRARGKGEGSEFTIITRQVHHLARLVDDLLDIERITRGKVALTWEVFELSEPIAKAIEIARPLVDRRRHALRISGGDAPLRVRGDRVRIAQVIANLLNNAAKYTPEGGTITLASHRDGEEAVLSVKDDGMGIPAALLPRVFDLFQQGRQGRDRAEGGLGIGLAVVKSLVTMHHGTVTAQSEGPGKGSEFQVRLPLSSAAQTIPSGPGAGIAPAGTRKQVLIVDDNRDAAEMLAEMLRRAGHAAAVATDPLTALSLLDEFQADAVLVDIGLPIMDGYELGRRIRERRPGQRLIALTGYGQRSDRERSVAAGFEAHLVKPIQATQVLELLERSS